MSIRKFWVPLAILAVAVHAQQPLPTLKIEATDGGSAFVLKNNASQPLTAYLIEMVDYPGSSFALSHDEIALGGQPLEAGKERRVPTTNMTIGAAPDYVKLLAAIYADGSLGGDAAKSAQLVERRRLNLSVVRDLAGRLDKAKSANTPKTAVIPDLKKWAESIPYTTSHTKRSLPETVDREMTRSVVRSAVQRLESQSIEEVLAALRSTERALAASKPAL